jgi:acyl-CoA synthetase (AMP-forming)/AMP-acid ligase II
MPSTNRAATSRVFNLADLFEIVADACPDRFALVAGDVRLTYEELDRRANRVAHHLLAHGVGQGDHVGIYAWNRAEWVEAMLGAYKARAVPINVNYRYVEDELRYIFDNADLAALVFERSFTPKVKAVLPDVPRLRHLIVVHDHVDDHDIDGESGDDATIGAVPYEVALARASPERDFDPRSPDDLYILYTGGTTGMPKGVMWRSEDIFFGAMGGGNFAGAPVERPEDLARGAANEPVVACVTAPLMHGGGQWVTFITFSTAGTVVLYTGRRYDAAEIWRIAARERANSLMVVGDAMARPLAEALVARDDSLDLSGLAAIGSGGAILSKAVKEQLRSALPGVMVIDSFGASETGANGSVMDLGAPAAGPRFTMGEHTTVLGDSLRPVTPGSGEIGRLAKRGHIPLGYYKDEGKTAATFLHDADGVRWVVPGDFATVEADGTITLLGRGSVSVNTGGEKVFPEEVEAALKAHPDVFDAVVVGVPDERFVERVVALVTPRPGTKPTIESLRDHCRTSIASYKAPRQVHLVDEIVRTPAGKPDYRWARARAAEAGDYPSVKGP